MFVSFVSFVFCQIVELLESLLASDGLKMLKMMCFRNLDSTATDKDDMDMLNKFMSKAKDVSLLRVNL